MSELVISDLDAIVLTRLGARAASHEEPWKARLSRSGSRRWARGAATPGPPWTRFANGWLHRIERSETAWNCCARIGSDEPIGD